jgi:hypothetical protein
MMNTFASGRINRSLLANRSIRQRKRDLETGDFTAGSLASHQTTHQALKWDAGC